MPNTFQQNQRLPATEKLKVSWTEDDIETLLFLRPFIKTDNGSYNFIKSILEIGSNYNNYLITIATNNIIAGWQQQYAQDPTWYLSCGNFGSSSCSTDKFIIIDTSTWDYTKRTVYSVSNSIETLGFTWEDLSTDTDNLVVSFDSVGGTYVEAYESVESGSLLPEPEDPHKASYSFSGWFKDSSYTEAWDFSSDTVEDHITLYAKWDEDADFYTVIEEIQADGTPLSVVEKSVNIPQASDTVKGLSLLSTALEIDELSSSEKVISENTLLSLLGDYYVLNSYLKPSAEALEELTGESSEEFSEEYYETLNTLLANVNGV